MCRCFVKLVGRVDAEFHRVKWFDLVARMLSTRDLEIRQPVLSIPDMRLTHLLVVNSLVHAKCRTISEGNSMRPDYSFPPTVNVGSVILLVMWLHTST